MKHMKSLNAKIPLLIVLVVASACQVDVKEPAPFVNTGHTVLGKKLNNPYTVANMRAAYERLKGGSASGRVAEELDIRTTHLYVKFRPDNWQEYDTLTLDSTIYFSDRPIDYEVDLQGDGYHDPSVPDTLPTFQYTAIPVGYLPPEGIDYEVIDELYLPSQDTAATADGRRQDMEALLDELEYEALLLTGNLDEQETRSDKGGRTQGLLPSKFHPTGYIRVFDTRLGRVIPIEGAKVRTTRWFETHEAITDANGYYRADGTFRYDFNSAVIWERSQFDVRSGTYGQAQYDGPRRKKAWDLTITDGVQRFYAHVFRGAHRYFYGNIDKLKRPNVWTKVKICAYNSNSDDSNGDNWGNWDISGLFPDIRIWRNVNDRERDSDEIFSTAVHEIAHGSHIQLMNGGEIQFLQVDEMIYESWAVAVQWHITSLTYRELGFANYADPFFEIPAGSFRLNYAYQNWNPNLDSKAGIYTSLFIDLVDNHNQTGRFQGVAIFDDIAGFDLKLIESNVLKHSYGLASLRQQLLQYLPQEITVQQLDEFLQQF